MVNDAGLLYRLHEVDFGLHDREVQKLKGIRMFLVLVEVWGGGVGGGISTTVVVIFVVFFNSKDYVPKM